MWKFISSSKFERLFLLRKIVSTLTVLLIVRIVWFVEYTEVHSLCYLSLNNFFVKTKKSHLENYKDVSAILINFYNNMIFSFRYGEAKVLPTQKVMIFYYFTVESISLLATNKKFLAGKKKKIWQDFSTEYISLFALNRIFWKTLTNKPLNLHYKVKITKNNKIEKVSERILVSNTSSFRQVRN